MKFSPSLLALLLLMGITMSSVWGQTATTTVNGFVRDAATGETLIGASVFSRNLRVGTLTNDYGFYSLTLPATDTATLTYSYAGYLTTNKKINLEGSPKIDVGLYDANTTLDDVVITAETTIEEQINSTQMSINTLTMEEAKAIPALFGEVDILKVLQLKPGVQSGGEGTSGLYVRGGGPDQNLIVLDEAIVYNANHLFGLFSTFNADAVKDVKLYKGGFPAQFGGRLSSVVDVKLKEGNDQKFSGQGGLGLISSRLTLEGPLDKEGKGSFILSGRRTYFDIITRQINKANEDKPDNNPIPDYYFYDLNAKVNYEFGESDRVYISGYFGKDVFGFNSDDFDFDFNWGNITTTARWNHLFSPKLFLNTTFTFSDYDYVIKNEFAETFKFEIGSKIQDLNLKTDFYFIPNNKHTIRFGAMATRHKFEVGRVEVSSTDSTINFNSGTELFANEFGAYISDDIEVSTRLKINGGLRLTGFQSDGTFYPGVEPRLAAKYGLSKKVSLKGSFAFMNQYIHLISNSGASLPTDIWYPSTEAVKPQQSVQVAGGLAINLGNKFLLTNEYYYKWLYNQIDYRDNANLFVNNNLEDEFLYGKGWAYGTEIYLEKKTGKLTGWIGYTLSFAWRQFDGSLMENATTLEKINDGRKFHPKYDRRHDISVVLIYQLARKWKLTGTWVYGTGNAISLPIGRSFDFDPISGEPQFKPIYGDRNDFRMPTYHRSDLGVVYTLFPKWGESDITLSIYNAYNRRNGFFIYNEQLDDRFQARLVSLFPVLPSLTWNFKF